MDLREHLYLKNVFIFPKYREILTFDEEVIIKNVHVFGNQIIKKGDLILELDTSNFDKYIRNKKYEIDLLEILYDDMKRKGASKYDLEIKKIDIKILEEELKKLKEKLGEHTIIAEYDCYISSGSMEIGRKVEIGETLLTISNANEYTLGTQQAINLDKFSNVKIGDEVQFTNQGNLSRGEVSFISFNENNTGTMYFKVIGEMTFSKKIIHGSYLSTEFRRVISDNALVIPKEAVKENKKFYIELLKDGVRRIRYVRIGAVGFENETDDIIPVEYIQVVSGLKEGESVIVDTITRSGDK